MKGRLLHGKPPFSFVRRVQVSAWFRPYFAAPDDPDAPEAPVLDRFSRSARHVS